MNLPRWKFFPPLFLPINVFIIGDSLGVGLQFSIIRIQETYLGWSTIFVWQELFFVLNGIITGRSALSILLWINGVVLLFFAAAILSFFSSKFGRKGISIYGIGCALLIISMMIQYGPLLNGPAGIAIPIGLPMLTFIGYLLWKEAAGKGEVEETHDDLAKDNDVILIPTMTGAAGTDD